MKEQKPTVIKDLSGSWRFVYPPSIDNDDMDNLFLEGADCLDYDDKKAEKIFKSIIEKHRYHIDAYNHLSCAFRNQKKTFESFLTAEKGYLLAHICLPHDFKPGKGKLSWNQLDNRPFLRSCLALGLEYQYRKDYEAAILYYKEALQHNPDDPQGARYLVLECLFALKAIDAAEKLLKKYPDEWSADFLYGNIIVAIYKDNLKKAKALLPDAIKYNPHIAEEIKKEKHIAPPPYKIAGESVVDGGFPVGSIQEAYDYWKRNKSILNARHVKAFFQEL